MAVSGKEQLCRQLLEFTQEEKIYQEYYELKNDPAARSAYLAQNADYVREKYMLIPELSDIYIPEDFSEQTYYAHLPLSRGSNVNVIRHLRYTPVFCYSTSFFEIFYILHGRTNHTLAGQTCVLSQGDVLFIPPGMKRTIEIFDDSVLLSIHIRHDTFEDAFFSTLRYDNILSDFFMSSLYSQRPARSILFPAGEDPDIRDIILDIYQETRLGDAYSWRLLNHLVSIFFARLLRGYADQAVLGSARNPGSRTRALSMLSFINDNYRTISLEKLAEHFHYSVPHCSKLIREETGIGFSAFVRKVKMNHAAALLLNTKNSTANISAMVGYENSESFIRAFEKVYHMSPTAYRKTQREKSGGSSD